MASTEEPPLRPQLPANFASELWQRHAAHQQRKREAISVGNSGTGSGPADHPPPSQPSAADITSFKAHLRSSTRILALLGAGLSAASGIPTFRGAGGFWREHDCVALATPNAFRRDPALGWQFYGYRRHGALQARPNAGHFALAELARRKPGMLAINQNIDGLCERAGHPPESIQRIHGSLFTIRCTECSYIEHDNFANPLVPALAQPPEVDLSDVRFPLKDIPVSELPRCPTPGCDALLRPGVVWFGEDLPTDALARVDTWLGPPSVSDAQSETAGENKVDLMLVVGTSAVVYPAAGYIHAARARGARIAVFNMEDAAHAEDEGATARLLEGDWFFRGDAAMLLPELLEDVVGKM